MSLAQTQRGSTCTLDTAVVGVVYNRKLAKVFSAKIYFQAIPESFLSRKPARYIIIYNRLYRRIHMNPDSIRIESSFVQSSSRLIRIESESRSHEQISSCNNAACSTLHVYYFHRQKKTRRSLIFAEVSGNLSASSPAISGAQTLSELRGLLQSGILIDLLIPCLIC